MLRVMRDMKWRKKLEELRIKKRCRVAKLCYIEHCELIEMNVGKEKLAWGLRRENRDTREDGEKPNNCIFIDIGFVN